MHLLTSILHKRYPTKKFYLSVFSLGGNVILKLLGELGDEAAKRNIAGAAVTCVPFDPTKSQTKLDVGFSRWAYSEVSICTILSYNLHKLNQFYYSFAVVSSNTENKSRGPQHRLPRSLRHRSGAQMRHHRRL
jgi:predicted alpha/beta-fold hydrolase